MFLITPENPASKNVLEETAYLIDNYKHAVQINGIKRVVCLSSIGARIEANTGNILMSRMLEQSLDNLAIDKVFVRPAYYFSNWLAFMDTIRNSNSLPTFFPQHLKLDMNSPIDVAQFIASIIAEYGSSTGKKIVELTGPVKYSSIDVAETFTKLFGKQINLQTIATEDWKQTLISAGFTEDTSANLMDMTQAVIDDIVVRENPAQVNRLPTTLYSYLKDCLLTQNAP